ncbi:MAG: hypothetical protein GEV08_07470 [Acidimicrobiia bacterium]|nr:hypothetical protein [Acidimicrobiia bacterium]
MGIRLEKAWTELTEPAVAALPGQLGVYELADEAGNVLRIGYAGGRTLFGLRSELAERLAEGPGRATAFRVEVNQQYLTRWQELLMVHLADHGALPPEQPDPGVRLGRLSPG